MSSRPRARAGRCRSSNSKEGTAIFHADAMRPGQQASGSVTITNTGTVNAALTLQAENAVRHPGQRRLHVPRASSSWS